MRTKIQVKTSRILHFISFFLCIFLASCKTSGIHPEDSSTASQSSSQQTNGDVFQGVSTEHYLGKIGQTSCGIKQEGLRKLVSLGYHYVAVPQAFFDKYRGKACGIVLEVTVGGACYAASNLNCLDQHAPLTQIGDSQKFSGETKVKLIVADTCPECGNMDRNGVKNFHLDILDTAYTETYTNTGKTAGPLMSLQQFLKAHDQTMKSPNGLTYHSNNLFLSKIERTGDCLNLAKLHTLGVELPGDAQYWLPGRYCD